MKTIADNLKVEYPAPWPLVQAVLGILRKKDRREYQLSPKILPTDKTAVFYVEEVPVAIWRGTVRGSESGWLFLSTENVARVTREYLKLSKTCYEWICRELEPNQVDEIVIRTPVWYPETIRWMDTYIGYLISRETLPGWTVSRMRRVRKGDE